MICPFFYPDQKKVEYILVTNIPFTLQQYKEDLGKPLSKIDFYLCKTLDIMNREIAIMDNELKFVVLEMELQIYGHLLKLSLHNMAN